MTPNARVVKAIPRKGPNGEDLVELTLEEGAHRKIKVTVSALAGGSYKNRWVYYDRARGTVTLPETPGDQQTA